jgi:peptide/nickel transport system ATP-binding protein
MNDPGGKPVVTVKNLGKTFEQRGGFLARGKALRAVDGVSFQIGRGQSFGLVGGSGSGKTTTGRMLVRLEEPSDGQIIFQDGRKSFDVAGLRGKSLKSFRRRAQIIFQDPYESLNPRRTVYDSVIEPLRVHRIGGPRQWRRCAEEFLVRVGLAPPHRYLFRYPHELSGGQRQRVAIARALIIEPALVVADEPTSMLDVSVRAGVIGLLDELRHELGVSYLLITHDLAVARYLCDEIAVMQGGRIVEQGSVERLLSNPGHQYSKLLLEAAGAAPDHPQPG